MGDTERYRVRAAELKAAVKAQTDYYLCSECEYISSVYLALADQADAAGRIG
jgi:hypothetical protein